MNKVIHDSRLAYRARMRKACDVLEQYPQTQIHPSWLEPPEEHKAILEPEVPVSLKTALLSAIGIAIFCFLMAHWVNQ